MVNKIMGENYDNQSLCDFSLFKEGVHFIDCSFKSAYLGFSERGTRSGKKKNFDFEKKILIFENCDFEGANFKGMHGLTYKNFNNPKNIGTATHLPESIYGYFKDTVCYNSRSPWAIEQPQLNSNSFYASGRNKKKNRAGVINLAGSESGFIDLVSSDSDTDNDIVDLVTDSDDESTLQF